VKGRYQTIRKIAAGGVGAVFEAVDTQLERKVAIKRLHSPEESKQNAKFVCDLRVEAAALSAFEHPNVLTIYDVDEDEQGCFVVTELIEGETLNQTVTRGAFTLADFSTIAEQIMEGIIAAHDRDLIHRDLKPENIMLEWLTCGRFVAKILDFGLAKFSEEPTEQTTDHNNGILGSVKFMAPEQFERKPLDKRTDLYSIGCLFYYTLAGKVPFRGKTPADTMNAHMSGKVENLADVRPDLPATVCDWVMWHLNAQADHRPESAQNSLDTLRMVLAANAALAFSAPVEQDSTTTTTTTAASGSDKAAAEAAKAEEKARKAEAKKSRRAARTRLIPTAKYAIQRAGERIAKDERVQSVKSALEKSYSLPSIPKPKLSKPEFIEKIPTDKMKRRVSDTLAKKVYASEIADAIPGKNLLSRLRPKGLTKKVTETISGALSKKVYMADLVPDQLSERVTQKVSDTFTKRYSLLDFIPQDHRETIEKLGSMRIFQPVADKLSSDVHFSNNDGESGTITSRLLQGISDTLGREFEAASIINAIPTGGIRSKQSALLHKVSGALGQEYSLSELVELAGENGGVEQKRNLKEFVEKLSKTFEEESRAMEVDDTAKVAKKQVRITSAAPEGSTTLTSQVKLA